VFVLYLFSISFFSQIEGAGKKIKPDEQQIIDKYKNEVYFLWQSKAWLDIEVENKIIRNVWKPYVDSIKLLDGV
jgi:hypothetical protein